MVMILVGSWQSDRFGLLIDSLYRYVTNCFGHMQMFAFPPLEVSAESVSGATPFSTQSMSAFNPSPGYHPCPPPQWFIPGA